jgi:eukaryotic-like serine/threonine-protein kinase
MTTEGDVELVGTVAGPYRVLSRVGTGVTGHVYEAERLDNGRRVALKVMHAHQQAEHGERFKREGKTLSLFQHRNIVEMLDVGQLGDGSLFLATELVRGVSLRGLVEDGYVDLRRALTIVRQVLEALSAAHAVGVVHRDIKPENIMLADGGSPDGTDLVKVLDFGVAKLLADTQHVLGENTLTQTGFSTFGSPHYIAPEIVLGRLVDQRADLYSVGALLFELVTGSAPFEADDVTALMLLHVNAPVPTLQSRMPDRTFTPQLEHLVAEALAKQVEHRFRSAGEMLSALDAAIDSLAVAAIADATQRTPPAGVLPAPCPSSGSPPRVDATPTPIPMAALVPRADATPAPAPLPTERPVVQRAAIAAAPARPDRRRFPALRGRQRLVVGAGVAVVALVVIAIGASGGGGKGSASPNDEVAKRARHLVSTGDAKAAVDLIEAAIASGKPQSGASYLQLGHALFASSRALDGLGAYEHALKLAASLAKDDTLRTNVIGALAGNGKETVAAAVALDLAARVSPPAYDEIVAVASTGKVADVRRRAVAIAEREGLAGKIDRVESGSLDLQQASTCDDRRRAIARLAATSDRRALAALKRARSQKCVEREATDAITRIEAGRESR